MAPDLDIDALLAELPDAHRPMVTLVVRLLQEQIGQLQAQLDKQTEQMAALTHTTKEFQRLLFGRRSEKKQPDARRGARKRAQAKKPAAQRAEERAEARKANEELLAKLPVVETIIDVPVAERVCTSCGSTNLKSFGPGAVSDRLEFVPAQLIRHRIVRKRYACNCKDCILTAPAPGQVTEGALYGPGLHAHVVVAKCADHIPLYRQAEQFKRAGSPIARASLCMLFHRSADQVDALYRCLLDHVAKASHVSADETPLPVLAEGGCSKGYIWTWVTPMVVAYTYSPTRSSDTPRRLLKDTPGVLQVDGYSGYNAVTGPDGRVRAACWAHVRRQFFRAQDTAPDAAAWAMDAISKLYDVEHRAAEAETVASAAHLHLRQVDAAPVVDALFAWLSEQLPQHPPKSPMGKAIRYATNQEAALRLFLSDAAIALDNNAAERALKPVALGRKNFLFAGHDEGAENLAKLQSIVSTCQLHGVNPQDYLADVLVRVNTHPASRLEELLPWNWASGKT